MRVARIRPIASTAAGEIRARYQSTLAERGTTMIDRLREMSASARRAKTSAEIGRWRTAWRYSRAVTGADAVGGRSCGGGRSRIAVSTAPRTEHADPHAPERRLGSQTGAQPDDRVLCRGVGNDEGWRGQSRTRSGVDDVPVAPLDHPGVGGHQPVHDAAQVDVDDPIPVGAGELVRRPTHRDPRVVEQQIEPPVTVHDLVDHRLHRIRITNVDRAAGHRALLPSGGDRVVGDGVRGGDGRARRRRRPGRRAPPRRPAARPSPDRCRIPHR